MTLKQFIDAFNHANIDALSKLLDESVFAISSSGKKFTGKKDVGEIYKELIKKYKEIALYVPGLYKDQEIIIVKHKVKNEWVIDSIKFVDVYGGTIRGITSTKN